MNYYNYSWIKGIGNNHLFLLKINPLKFVAGNETYYIPPVNPDIEIYRKYIEQLPLVDDPEVFGLNGNADLAYRTAQTKTTLDDGLKVAFGTPGHTEIVYPTTVSLVFEFIDNDEAVKIVDKIARKGGTAEEACRFK